MSNLNWSEITPSTKQGTNVPYMTIKNGDQNIRVISNPIIDKYQHYIGSKYENCTNDKDCILCQQNIARKVVYKCYVIDHSDENKIKILSFGQQIMNEFVAIFQDPEQAEFGAYNEYSLKLNKSGSAKTTNYTAKAINGKKYLEKLTPEKFVEIQALSDLTPGSFKVTGKVDQEDPDLAKNSLAEVANEVSQVINNAAKTAGNMISNTSSDEDWNSI